MKSAVHHVRGLRNERRADWPTIEERPLSLYGSPQWWNESQPSRQTMFEFDWAKDEAPWLLYRSSTTLRWNKRQARRQTKSELDWAADEGSKLSFLFSAMLWRNFGIGGLRFGCQVRKIKGGCRQMVGEKRMAKNGKSDKVSSPRPIETLAVSRGELNTSGEAVRLRLAVIRDLAESRITPTVANALGAQVSGIVKIKEMEFKYGQPNKSGGKHFLLTEGATA